MCVDFYVSRLGLICIEHFFLGFCWNSCERRDVIGSVHGCCGFVRGMNSHSCVHVVVEFLSPSYVIMCKVCSSFQPADGHFVKASRNVDKL